MMQGYRADVARYTQGGVASQVRAVLQNQGLWALAVYRFFHPLVRHRNPLVRKSAAVGALLGTKAMEVLTGILLPVRAEIGPGCYFPHFGPVIINQDARIGAYATFLHNTTLGNSGRWDRLEHDAPVLGDRVYFGAGASAIGPITIGDDAVLGAGAVVTKSLPARAVAVGSPAEIVSMRGSFRYVAYVGMDVDPGRVASRAIADAGTEAVPDDPALTPARRRGA